MHALYAGCLATGKGCFVKPVKGTTAKAGWGTGEYSKASAVSFVRGAGLAASLALMLPICATAAIHKCTDADGQVTYSERPCADTAESVTMTPTTDSATGEDPFLSRWEGYCVATFKRDYDIKDMFGETLLHVSRGDRYLLSSLNHAGYWDAILYPQGRTVVSYKFKHPERNHPFTTACQASSERVYTVLDDTVLYADKALTQPVCQLDAGTAIDGSFEFANHVQKGYAKFRYFGAAQRCRGHDLFYVRVEMADIQGVSQAVEPFAFLMAPGE